MRKPVVLTIAAAFGLIGAFPSSSARDAEVRLSVPALEKAWSVDGRWSGVAIPKGSPVAYATQSGKLFSVNLKDGSATALSDNVESTVRVGVNDRDTMLVAFDIWGKKVTACTTKGERLWSYDTTDGIDDVWPVDLDGDGASEVVVGLNGFGGVLVLGSGGRVLWSDKTIGNVWHVTAGPMDGKTLRVVTTSSKGQVHVFSVTGERIKDLDPPMYANWVRFGDEPFVGGDKGEGSVIATLDPSGWTARLSKHEADIGSLAVAPSIPWVAASTEQGDVYVFRSTDGSLYGAGWGGGRSPQLAWGSFGDDALLLSASRGGLTAYRVTPSP